MLRPLLEQPESAYHQVERGMVGFSGALSSLTLSILDARILVGPVEGLAELPGNREWEVLDCARFDSPLRLSPIR